MAIATHEVDISLGQSAVQGLSKQRRVLAVLFVVSFALDFKGTAGGSPIQLLMAGLNIVTFLLLAISYRMAIPGKGLAAFVFWGWGAFLAVGTVGAMANAAPFGHFIRIAYTFTLFLEGFLVSTWVARDPRGAKLIISAMLVAAIVSLVFTFWWGFYFTGENVGGIRYQILSPLIPLLIVVAGYDWLLARRRRIRSLLILGAVFGIIALSVTRGMILIAGFVAVPVLLATFSNAMQTSKFPRPIIHVVVAVPTTVVVVLFAAMLLYPEVIARWADRVLGAARDATFWTRVAAINGQYQALTANHYGWLTGQGFGSSYPWPLSDFPWILQYMGPDAIGRSVWFPGEFMWMPFLYYGGFIVGPVAALVLLAGAVRAFRLLSILLKMRSWRDLQMRPLWVGVLGYFAFLGMGFTANPFILRLAAMFMGLCLGLVLKQGKMLMMDGRIFNHVDDQ